jgi:CDP-paratose 2-epimerase
MNSRGINRNGRNDKPITGIVEWFHLNEYKRVEEAMSDLRELGITELRTGISWADWHREDGRQWIEHLIKTLGAKLNILPCFLYTPPSMALAPKASSPPKDPKSYADFIDVILTEYGDYFEWVELWNEPNNLSEWDYTLDNNWNIFAEMAGGAAYWCRKRGKKTLLGGMSPIDPNWLEYMFQRGVMEHIDAVGIHGFPDVFDYRWTGWNEKIKSVQDVLDKNNNKAKIWITETGFPTWQLDERKQLKVFLEAMEAPVERVYWYELRDLDPHRPTVDGFRLDSREYFFGLKDADNSPKLLYRLIENSGAGSIAKYKWIAESGTEGLSMGKDTILITGGAGFIGIHLAERLLSEGEKVIIYDNLSRAGTEKDLQELKEKYPGRLYIEIADVRNKESLSSAVKHAAFVYHLASNDNGHVSREYSFEVNAAGTFNLLEAAKEMENPPPVIFTSSYKVYGSLESLKLRRKGLRYEPEDEEIRLNGVNESMQPEPGGINEFSLLTAENYILEYSRLYGLRNLVLRLGCVYGINGNSWVEMISARSIEGKRIGVEGDGRQLRDLLYIDDLISAMTGARDKIDDLAGECYNLGGGADNSISPLGLIKLLSLITGERLKYSFHEDREGGAHYYVSDSTKFSKASGWKPSVTAKRGIMKVYEHFLNKSKGSIKLKNRIKELAY